MWNLFGVVVFQRSVLDWRRAWSQSDTDICAFFYLWNLFGVVVFQRSMLDWKRGWDQSAMGICAFFYMWNLFGVCKCRFLILFFHMFSYLFLINRTILLERQAFNRFSCLHQVLKKIFSYANLYTLKGVSENIMQNIFVYNIFQFFSIFVCKTDVTVLYCDRCYVTCLYSLLADVMPYL